MFRTWFRRFAPLPFARIASGARCGSRRRPQRSARGTLEGEACARQGSARAGEGWSVAATRIRRANKVKTGRERYAAVPEKLTFQPFAQPRTGTNLRTCKSSFTSEGFRGRRSSRAKLYRSHTRKGSLVTTALTRPLVAMTRTCSSCPFANCARSMPNVGSRNPTATVCHVLPRSVLT